MLAEACDTFQNVFVLASKPQTEPDSTIQATSETWPSSPLGNWAQGLLRRGELDRRWGVNGLEGNDFTSETEITSLTPTAGGQVGASYLPLLHNAI